MRDFFRRKDNRGLSLVELIVAFAIFAIAGVAICGFVAFCSKNFTNSNKNVKLQYEQQIVINQVRDAILETSRGISKPVVNGTKTSFSVCSDNYDTSSMGALPYVITSFVFDKADDAEVGTLSMEYRYLDQSAFTPTEGGTPITLDGLLGSAGPSATVEVSRNIAEFSLIDFEKNLKDNKVQLKIVFKTGDKEITVNPLISLRNILSDIDDTTSLDELYKKEVIEVYSIIQKVVIYRDGKAFAQSKTDTIAMAMDEGTSLQSASAQYEAKVTPKSSYKGAFDPTVTWSLEGLDAGAENCITVSASGLVTVKEYVDADGNKHEPKEYMTNGESFVLKATSNEDDTRYARIRIRVTGNGVYPVSITFNEPTYKVDYESAKVVYSFTHDITYTANVKDPVSGNMVNPLTGDGVYSKITYTVDGDAIPTGAGFITNGGVATGQFIVTKDMEEKTYTITVTVLQRNKDGEPVSATFSFTIPKGIVPEERSTGTKPVLNAPDTAIRATQTAMSASWSSGALTYLDENNNNRETAYNYWYEWEIVPGDCDKWGTGERYSFSNINLWNGSSKGHTYTGTSSNDRVMYVDIPYYLSWEDTFTFKVNLRVKVGKGWNSGEAAYFKLAPEGSTDLADFTTSSRDEAYVVSKVITIKPVSVLMTPQPIIKFEQNDKVQNYIFNAEDKFGNASIGLGRKENKTEKVEAADEYIFVYLPKFEGIEFSILNYSWASIQNSFGKDDDNKSSAFQIYSVKKSGIEYKDMEPTDSKDWNSKCFLTGIRQQDITHPNGSEMYAYIQIKPSKWASTGTTTDQLPVGARWKCVFKDDKENNVVAKFSIDGSEWANYILYNDYEGEYHYNN